MQSIVMFFDTKKGEFTKEILYSLSPQKALISAVMQHKGNYATNTYPKNIEGIYKSIVKGRLLYDVDENITIYAQPL